MRLIVAMPFKGRWYYELQLFNVVFMWQHDMDHEPSSTSGLRWGRLHIWIDSAWDWSRQAWPPLWLRRKRG